MKYGWDEEVCREIKWEMIVIGWKKKVDEEIKWEMVVIGWHREVGGSIYTWDKFWMLEVAIICDEVVIVNLTCQPRYFL